MEEGLTERRPDRPRRLDQETVSYLKQVQGLLADEETHGEEREVLIGNVIQELQHKEASAASDKHVSAIIEQLLRLSPPREVRRYLSKFKGYFLFLFCNRYSSHVLQTILRIAGPLIEAEAQGNIENEVDEDERSTDDVEEVPPMTELILAMCEEISGQWEDLFYDLSASHVVRSLVCVLAGREEVQEKRGKHVKHRPIFPNNARTDGVEPKRFEVPESFAPLLESICTKLSESPSATLLQSACNENTGPLLQLILRISKERDGSADDIIKRSLRWNDPESFAKSIQTLNHDRVGSHYVEAILETCSSSLFKKIYRLCFEGKQRVLIDDPTANFIIQQLYLRVASKRLFRSMFDELSGWGIGKLFNANRLGVLWRVVEAALRLETLQEEVAEAVLSAAEGHNAKGGLSENLLAISLDEGKDRISINVPGARIIQNLLLFPPSTVMPLVDSIASLSKEKLIALAKDGTGSRCVVEPILDGPKEFDAAKLKLVDAAKGQIANLASERFGCYFVQKAFRAISDTQRRVAIAEELLAARSRVAGSHFGRMVLETCKIQLFKTNRKQWLGGQDKAEKVSKMFADILTSDQKTGKSESEPKRKREPEGKSDEKLEPFLETLGFASRKGTHTEEGLRKKRKKLEEVKQNPKEDLEFVFKALSRSAEENEADSGTKKTKKSKKKSK